MNIMCTVLQRHYTRSNQPSVQAVKGTALPESESSVGCQQLITVAGGIWCAE